MSKNVAIPEILFANAKGMWGSRRKKDKDKGKDKKAAPAHEEDDDMAALYEELLACLTANKKLSFYGIIK